MSNCIVIGCGFVGSMVARRLAESGNKVLLFEKRGHIAGNMFDATDENGIRVQQYGPHIFHTNSEEVYRYITQYGNWTPYFMRCMVYMDGRFTPSPFNFKTIDDFYSRKDAETLKLRLRDQYGARTSATIVELLQCEDELIRGYADFLFEKDYAPYTAKQWGISPSEIDISVLQRVPVLFSYEDGYFDDTYQIMPENGYTAVFEDILSHPNLQVNLNRDALDHLRIDYDNRRMLWDGERISGPVLYTGPLDELCGSVFGYLPYRSLRFDYRRLSKESYQEAPVVAYPQEPGYTRITEYKKLPVQKAPGVTTVAVEYPLQYDPKATEPYYPVLTRESQALYQKYKDMVSAIPGLYIGGRLADYKYYNMDQAIQRAFTVCEEMGI